MSTEEQDQAKYEEDASQRREYQRQHEMAQMLEAESRLRDLNLKARSFPW